MAVYLYSNARLRVAGPKKFQKAIFGLQQFENGPILKTKKSK